MPSKINHAENETQLV